VPIAVTGGAGAPEPATATLTVKGPQRLLHNFKVPDGAVHVDAAGLEPGTHRVPVQIDLPPTLEVVEHDPDAVRLQVTRQEERG
jgi:YbbR domain-containing protein